jgi:transposase
MQNYNESQKLKLINLYEAGMRVQQICGTFSIPRSTMYSWLKKHRKIKMGNGTTITAKDYYLLEKKLKKVETDYGTYLKFYTILFLECNFKICG